MTVILISSNPDKLEAALKAASLYYSTVEAEYGDRVVEGTIATLAHHGPRQGNPCPCLRANANWAKTVEGCQFHACFPEAFCFDCMRVLGPSVIGLSHIDLDTLGGVAAQLDRKPSSQTFWELAAFVDTHGVHKIGAWLAKMMINGPEAVAKLNAYYAWSKAHRYSPPRDGSVEDITEKVEEGLQFLEMLLGGPSEGQTSAIEAGKVFAAQEDALNSSSFLTYDRGVVVRKSDSFVNHLYNLPPDSHYCPPGFTARAVVTLNTKGGGINISLADPISGVSCRKIVQALWGPEAGGHDGIAGSPRGKVMTENDLIRAADATTEAINGVQRGPHGDDPRDDR